MNLRISDPKIDELAAELANRTGENPTQAVVRALEEKLQRQPHPAAVSQDEAAKLADRERRKAEILAILARIDKLPILDTRTPDEIIGYNEYGAFD
jgi:antitoxin VapB